MSINNHDRRLEKLEDFMQRLTLNSYVAKAAAFGERVLGEELSDGDGELTGAVTGDVRVNQCVNRLDKLERRFNALYNELIGAKPAQQDNDQEALNVLAKAQNAVKRKTTPEGLLARAQAVIADPTEFGIVEAHVQAGQFRKAAEMLEQHEKRATHADEDAAQQQVESQIDTYDQMATISELGEKMAAFEEAMTGLLSRLARLERPQPAPVQEAVVAKGYGKRRKPTAYEDSVQGLMARTDGVVDSPARVGYLNSLLQSGDPAQIEQARAAIEAAEVAHESDVRKRDRRSL